jgi:hypothetical protein
LKLDDNAVVLQFPDDEINQLLLDDEGEDDEEESVAGKASSNGKEEKAKMIEVEVKLSLTALANARDIYQNKKIAEMKENKTIVHSAKVMQTVQEQTMKALEKQKISHTIKAQRKVHWFEKFNWFITTEGFLVLSGKDAQQNEVLFKKYLRKEDIYVHADLAGASSCIVRAKRKSEHSETIDIPNAIQSEDKYFTTPLAIQEAGIFAVCRSRAWQAKIITSSYWVRASQVSKSAPSGEYLTTGSFMIYGKKNYLPPMPLEMGFGVLFRLDDSSVVKHLHERKIKSYELDDESVVSFQDAAERYGIEEVEIGGGGEDDRIPETVHEEDENADEDENEEGEGDEIEETADNIETSEEQNEETENIEESVEQMQINEDKQNIESVPEKEVTSDEEEEEKEEEDLVPQPAATKGKNDKKNNKPNKKSESQEPELAAGSQKKKKKHMDKKKARRYAEQDEEDRELAMMILGHASAKGEKINDKIDKIMTEKKTEDIKSRQLKAGVNLLNTNWKKLLDLQHGTIQHEFNKLIAQEGLLKENEIEEKEMRALSVFPEEDGLKILNLFRDSKQLSKSNNKTVILANIMREYTRELEENKKIGGKHTEKKNKNSETSKVSSDPSETKNDPSKKNEEKEIEEINFEEGILDDQDENFKFSDDIDKLFPNPTGEDKILYAVPVCAPYMSMKNFKFRVKLTPGSLKKGKAVKQAMDLFTRSKECSPTEKNMMKHLNDNELNSVMIGDVKISMPGLFQMTKQIKKQKPRGQYSK